MNESESTDTNESRSRRTRFVWTACTVLLIVLLDQFTKALIVARVPRGASFEVIPGIFNICHTVNTGVVFGLFPGMPSVFAVLTVIAIIVLIGLVWSLDHSVSLVQFASYGLLIGGAIGNLVDRVRLHGVTDFLDFYIGRHHWPAFNVADSAVCVGVALLLLSTAFEVRQEQGDVST
jgi:signal peptidase II